MSPPMWLDIAWRVWYFRFRRWRLWLNKFSLQYIALPPVYGVMGTELSDVHGYWRLQTPWFGVRLEGWDAKGRNIFA